MYFTGWRSFQGKTGEKMWGDKFQWHQMRAGPRGSSVAMRCVSGAPTTMCVGMSMTQSLRLGSIAMVSAYLG